jgi:hypothetical protein
MEIQKFAEKYGLKTRIDEDETVIIPGRKHRVLGGQGINHIYQHDGQLLGVMIGFPTARMWNFSRRLLTQLGLKIQQDGDCEGSLTFDPANQTQAKAAIREAKVKPKRVMSEAQAKVLKDARNRSPLMRQTFAKPQKASPNASMGLEAAQVPKVKT